MATLKELMGDLKRGDGRKFTQWENKPMRYFEPIFFSNENLWVGLNECGTTNSYQGCGDVWQEWHPPKTKVKLYKWAVKNSAGFWVEGNTFFRDDEDHGDGTWMRLDYTCIEVDE